MRPGFRSVVANTTPNTPLAITPAPVATHDFLVAVHVADIAAGTVVSLATGFTQRALQSTTGDGQTVTVSTKTDGLGGEGSQSFDFSSTVIGAIAAFYGIDTLNPLDVAAVVANNNTATASPWTITASLTTKTDGCLIVAIMGSDANNTGDVVHTFSSTIGTTGPWTVHTDPNNSFINFAIASAYQPKAGTLTVQGTGTLATVSAGRSIVLLALRPSIANRRTRPRRVLTAAAASGAITGNAALSFAAAGALLGSGAMTGPATLTFTPSAALAGAGALAGDTTVTFTPAATALAVGAMTGPTTLTFMPAATALGAGAMAANANLTFTGAGTLLGAGALAGATTLTFAVTGDCANLGSGSMTGNATITFAPAGTLTGAGAMAGATTITFAPAATAGGAGSMIGNAPVTFAAAATAALAGAIAGNANLTFTPAATPRGDGALAGSSTLTFAPVGSLTGAGAMVGASTLVFTLSGTLVDLSAPVVEVIPITGILSLDVKTGVAELEITGPGGIRIDTGTAELDVEGIDSLRIDRRVVH